jgi:hypothetical protein
LTWKPATPTDHTSKIVLANDFTSTPDELLNILLRENTEYGTNFIKGLQAS